MTTGKDYGYEGKFDYTDPEEWKNFGKNEIMPIYKSISKIEKVRKKIVEKLNNNSLSELLRKDKAIQQILLGGVDKNGKYKPNSLAKIYKEFLGFSIDTERWVKLSEEGFDSGELIDQLLNKPEDTPFMKFITEAKEIVGILPLRLGISEEEPTEEEINEIVENPIKIGDELKELYKRLVNITANYNYHTFFAINTRCIPKYYIEKVYPKLKDISKKVAFKDKITLGEFLGIKEETIIDVEEEEKKRDYTVLRHIEGRLLDMLYKLNETIWVYSEDLNKCYKNLIVGEVEDLMLEYVKSAVSSLNKTIGWKFPDYIDRDDLEYEEVEFPISDIFIKYYDYGGYYPTKPTEIPISKFLEKMAPAFFLGLLELNIRKNKNIIKIMPIYYLKDLSDVLFEEEY